MSTFEKLMAYAPEGKTDFDWEVPLLQTAIEDLQKKGWTEAEIIGHLRWLEHVDPRIEEDVALRHLKRTREAVELRLKT